MKVIRDKKIISGLGITLQQIEDSTINTIKLPIGEFKADRWNGLSTTVEKGKIYETYTVQVSEPINGEFPFFDFKTCNGKIVSVSF